MNNNVEYQILFPAFVMTEFREIIEHLQSTNGVKNKIYDYRIGYIH